MKKFCEISREHAMIIINLKKKKMRLLTEELKESYENAKFCYICKKKLKINIWKIKKYCKGNDHCHYTGEYRGPAHSICNFKYSVTKTIAIVLDLIMIIILS